MIPNDPVYLHALDLLSSVEFEAGRPLFFGDFSCSLVLTCEAAEGGVLYTGTVTTVPLKREALSELCWTMSTYEKIILRGRLSHLAGFRCVLGSELCDKKEKIIFRLGRAHDGVTLADLHNFFDEVWEHAPFYWSKSVLYSRGPDRPDNTFTFSADVWPYPGEDGVMPMICCLGAGLRPGPILRDVPYGVIGADGQLIAVGRTDGKGHFYVRNRFDGEAKIRYVGLGKTHEEERIAEALVKTGSLEVKP